MRKRRGGRRSKCPFRGSDSNAYTGVDAESDSNAYVGIDTVYDSNVYARSDSQPDSNAHVIARIYSAAIEVGMIRHGKVA